MRIGALARATDLTTKTIRFYEEEGLLPPPGCTSSGYRVYGQEDAGRLEFIRKAKRLGLSLEDIGGILRLHDREEPTCVHVRSLLDEKLAQVDRVLEDLRAFRADLGRLRDTAGTLLDCGPSGGRICGIVEESMVRVSDAAIAWMELKPGRG